MEEREKKCNVGSFARDLDAEVGILCPASCVSSSEEKNLIVLLFF